MVDAVRRISGIEGEALTAISNEGRDPEELVLAIKDVSAAHPTLIFTDLQTGNCALAARLACRPPSDVRVVFGTNLPMLLDFVFHRDIPLDDLQERLIKLGRYAIDSFEPEAVERGDRSI
jgi:mannose/fructose-specific phosphotransferase system component IIA